MPKKLIPILFRADVSHALGTGNIMRCIAFANGLPKSFSPTFVFRNYPGSDAILPILHKKKWYIAKLPEAMSERSEISAIKTLALKTNSSLIVVDLVCASVFESPHRIADYCRKLRSIDGLYVISIEDSRLTDFTSHMAIIGNTIYPADEKRKKNQNCLILEGTKYFICHENVTAYTKRSRIIRRVANRILVFIGGSDVAGVTACVLAAVLENFIDHNLEIKVILGPTMASSLRSQIIDIVARLQHVELIPFTDNIGALLLWADIAIVGEGTIKFEAAILGTPTLVISQFDHDSKPMRDFLSIGCAMHLKFSVDLTSIMIFKKMFDLLADYSARLAMSTAAKNFFDGKAVQRIYNKFKEHLILDEPEEVIKNGMG